MCYQVTINKFEHVALKDSCKCALHMHLAYYEKKYGQSIVEFLNDVNLVSIIFFYLYKKSTIYFSYHKLM